MIRAPRIRFFFWGEEEFCEFELEGVTFVILEPFGDNDRYLIAGKKPEASPQLNRVREEFAGWRPFGLLEDLLAKFLPPRVTRPPTPSEPRR